MQLVNTTEEKKRRLKQRKHPTPTVVARYVTNLHNGANHLGEDEDETLMTSTLNIKDLKTRNFAW